MSSVPSVAALVTESHCVAELGPSRSTCIASECFEVVLDHVGGRSASSCDWAENCMLRLRCPVGSTFSVMAKLLSLLF